MKQITFNMSSLHLHGSAWYDYLRLRKSYFVDGLDWGIPNDGDVEMDQYDTPQTWYSCVVQDGQMLGGARILPSTADWGGRGFMIGDTLKGLIPGIPQTGVPNIAASPELWECSRLVMCPSIKTVADRAQALELIVNGLVKITQAHGGKEMVTLTRVSFLRTLRSLGYAVTQQHAAYRCEGDGNRYTVMAMPAIASGHAIAAE